MSNLNTVTSKENNGDNILNVKDNILSLSQNQNISPLTSKNNLDYISNNELTAVKSNGSATQKAKKVVKKSANPANVDKKKKKRKNMCHMVDCKDHIAKFIGDCEFCKGQFCSKHRLMESHECQGLADCKDLMHKRNADKLNKEQTVIPKVQL